MAELIVVMTIWLDGWIDGGRKCSRPVPRCVNCDREEDVYRIIILEDSVGWFLIHHSLRGHS